MIMNLSSFAGRVRRMVRGVLAGALAIGLHAAATATSGAETVYVPLTEFCETNGGIMAMPPVSSVTLRFPPERVTGAKKFTVTSIIAPVPYVPSTVPDVTLVTDAG